MLGDVLGRAEGVVLGLTLGNAVGTVGRPVGASDGAGDGLGHAMQSMVRFCAHIPHVMSFRTTTICDPPSTYVTPNVSA